MKRNMTALLLAGLLLALTGCQLARPEAENPAQDRFCGLYIVYSGSYTGHFSDNPHLTELGTEAVDAGKYGSFDVPREVLVFDQETAAFPGLEGYSLFVYQGVSGDGGGYSVYVSDIEEPSTCTTVTDQGSRNELEGTVCYGPPLGVSDWDSYESRGLFHAYRVYQTKDGTVYLDGSGDIYGGGGSMSFTETAAYTSSMNGETATEYTVSATVHIEAVPRLEQLTVSQFDENNALLCSDSLPLAEELPAVTARESAAWVLVEERFADGTAERTAYTVPGPGGDPISHTVILLSDSGMGRGAQLTIQ